MFYGPGVFFFVGVCGVCDDTQKKTNLMSMWSVVVVVAKAVWDSSNHNI